MYMQLDIIVPLVRTLPKLFRQKEMCGYIAPVSSFFFPTLQWRTQRGVRGVQIPPLNLQRNFVLCVCKIYSPSLLLCSLNPKFYTGKR